MGQVMVDASYVAVDASYVAVDAVDDEGDQHAVGEKNEKIELG
jgi:hypothetical protein